MGVKSNNIFLSNTNLTNNNNLSTTTTNNQHTLKQRYKYLEFKHLYFRVQKVINKQVTFGVKYEQFKTPDIYNKLVKPTTEKVIKVSDNNVISLKLKSIIPSVNFPIDQTPKFGPQLSPKKLRTNYRPINGAEEKLKLSMYLVFILLLLRYEYLIQSQNNLILYDLLTTKANLCEFLAIRMLKEYTSFNRINLLFLTPLNNDNFIFGQRKDFNTLELSVLTKSKRFLSQPIMKRILDRFYDGELIIKISDVVEDAFEEEQLLDTGVGNDHDVINYKYNKISFNKIIQRSNIVPKYQSLVINLKVLFFMLLYFTMILNKKHQESGTGARHIILNIVEAIFWLVGLNFNVEFLMKISHIEFQFFKKIIWNYIDFILIVLIDGSFLLKIMGLIYYQDMFSLISIVLLPRTLSLFNNYKFFNLIIVSFKKMVWNLVGLCTLFFSLISGFYFSFVTLSKGRTNYDIMFDMVKIFFGFTPSVWNNWDNYNNVGRIIQMGYLFLIQFIIGTILAIVLSGVFAQVNETNEEDFNYFKAINLILYFKSARLHYQGVLYKHKHHWFGLQIRHGLNQILSVFKLPTIILIFCYEKMLSRVYERRLATGSVLKNFTFLIREDDYYQDTDLMHIESGRFQFEFGATDNEEELLEGAMVDDDDDISVLLMKSRKNSLFKPGVVAPSQMQPRRYSNIDPNTNFRNSQNWMPTQSKLTLRGQQEYDGLFIDDLLSRKGKGYLEKLKTNNSDSLGPSDKGERRKRDDEMLQRMHHLEELVSKLIEGESSKEENDDGNIYNITEVSIDDMELINSDVSAYSGGKETQLENELDDTLSEIGDDEAVSEIGDDDTF